MTDTEHEKQINSKKKIGKNLKHFQKAFFIVSVFSMCLDSNCYN